jgi:hypothetical protein
MAIVSNTQAWLTSKEASQVFSAICMLDTVKEATVLVCLHASLDAVEGESGQGGKDARRAGGYLGPVTPDEGVGMVSSAGG